MGDPDMVEADAQTVRANLRQHRLDPRPIEAAPVITSIAPSLAKYDADIVERAEPAFLDKKAKPQADRLARLPAPGDIRAQRSPTDPVQELVEQARIVAGVLDDVGAEGVEFAAERHRRFRDEIAAPDRDRVEPEPVGDRVDEPLAHKTRLETAGRAIGAARRLVGQPHMADRTVGRDQ